MPKLKHQPPLQRCSCGTEYFVVHECPLVTTSALPEGVPLMKKRLQDMAQLVSELQREKAKLQDTVNDLMLEISELREVLALKQEQAREVLPG